MSIRSTARSPGTGPSTFAGELPTFRVIGWHKGKGWRLSVTLKGEVFVVRMTIGNSWVEFEIERKDAGEILSVLPMVKPARGNGKSYDEAPKRKTFLLNEKGEIEDTTIVIMSDEEMERARALPPELVIPAENAPVPFGRCVEYSDANGEVIRTEWSKRRGIRRAA
ncbi:MAG: hypothetical protein U0804_02715 [Gemmataceae bacterium]